MDIEAQIRPLLEETNGWKPLLPSVYVICTNAKIEDEKSLRNIPWVIVFDCLSVPNQYSWISWLSYEFIFPVLWWFHLEFLKVTPAALFSIDYISTLEKSLYNEKSQWIDEAQQMMSVISDNLQQMSFLQLDSMDAKVRLGLARTVMLVFVFIV